MTLLQLDMLNMSLQGLSHVSLVKNRVTAMGRFNLGNLDDGKETASTVDYFEASTEFHTGDATNKGGF